MGNILDFDGFNQKRNEQILVEAISQLPPDIVTNMLIQSMDTLKQIRDSAEKISEDLSKVSQTFIDKLPLDFPIEDISNHLDIEAKMADALITTLIKLVGGT